jgi:hypothetical protein
MYWSNAYLQKPRICAGLYSGGYSGLEIWRVLVHFHCGTTLLWCLAHELDRIYVVENK